jgi:YbbR domain-containing protein
MQKSRLISIIISLLAAIGLWIYVVTIVNPVRNTTLTHIPVTFSGEDALRADQNLVITTGKDSTVSVNFYGKNSDLKKLEKNQSEITAVVDVSKIRTAKQYTMGYDLQLPASVQDSVITISSRSPSLISFTVESYVTKSFEIKTDVTGVEVAAGYMLDSAKLDYDAVSVSGPESVVNSIAGAQVAVSKTNLDKTVTQKADYTLVDADGNPVDKTQLTTDIDSVEVTLSVVKYKEVPLDVEFIDGGGATASDVSMDINPSKITISGDSTVLDGINKIVLGNIDLSNTDNNAVVSFQIIIPDGAKNVSGEQQASVTVKIKNKDTSVIRATNIAFIGVPEGFDATSVTQLVQTKVRAASDEIRKISTADLRVVADMSEYTQAGTYTVPVSILIDGYSDAGVIGDYTIVATLTAKTPEP